MRILFVTPHLPYPPTDGGRIGCFNQIKYISRRHEVFLLSYIDRAEEADLAAELGIYCANVETLLRRNGAGIVMLLRGLVGSRPGTMAKYWSLPMALAVRENVQRFRADLVHFDFLHLAPLRSYAGAVPAVLREHNVEYVVWQRHAEYGDSVLQRAYTRYCAPRIRRYEARAARQFDRCVVVTAADARHLAEIAPSAKIEVIPSGVDTEYFFPMEEPPETPFRMAITGSFEWKPKQHNLRILATSIFPLIRAALPQAELFVVGKGVPAELREEVEGVPGVRVTGGVPDVRPHLAGAALVVNYVEIGGGIALKVLEAMAMRKAIITNSRGSEGIEARDGQEIVIADGISHFVSAAIALLQDSGSRAALAENAYRLARSKYSWESIASRFEDCYLDVIQNSAVSR
jgi:glycosyltransferase involved in cell wall biosynthesis